MDLPSNDVILCKKKTEKGMIRAFRNTNAYIYTQQSAHTVRGHTALKMNHL